MNFKYKMDTVSARAARKLTGTVSSSCFLLILVPLKKSEDEGKVQEKFVMA